MQKNGGIVYIDKFVWN